MITISTALTILRLILTPVIVFLMLAHAWHAAFWLFMVAALTDMLDGYLARLLHQETILGTYLDPIADKCLLVSCFIALAFIRSPLFYVPSWFVVLILIKEILLLGGAALVAFRMRNLTVRPTIFGKLATVVQIAFVIWLLLSATAESVNTVWYAGFIWAMVILSLITLIDYARIGYRQCFT